MIKHVFLPAMRMTALSAGSSTSPDADLERLTRWCLARFHGSVSPGKGEVLNSLGLSSDADLSLRRGGRDMAWNKVYNKAEKYKQAACGLNLPAFQFEKEMSS